MKNETKEEREERKGMYIALGLKTAFGYNLDKLRKELEDKFEKHNPLKEQPFTQKYGKEIVGIILVVLTFLALIK